MEVMCKFGKCKGASDATVNLEAMVSCDLIVEHSHCSLLCIDASMCT